MIFYFSGTGNSKWVAEEIAKGSDDKALDLANLELTNELKETFYNEERIGFVFPIYAWGMPEPVEKFVENFSFSNNFKFVICTCGADVGKGAKKLLSKINGDSAYSVVMPSNYIVGANLENEKVIKEKIENARKQIQKISKEILEKKKTYEVNEGGLAFLKSSIVNWGFNNFARGTKKFYATDKCISCGLCQYVCPAKTIIIRDKKPQWGEKCYQCMACINRCPQGAIQYGKKTKTRGRYYFDNWKE